MGRPGPHLKCRLGLRDVGDAANPHTAILALLVAIVVHNWLPVKEDRHKMVTKLSIHRGSYASLINLI